MHIFPLLCVSCSIVLSSLCLWLRLAVPDLLFCAFFCFLFTRMYGTLRSTFVVFLSSTWNKVLTHRPKYVCTDRDTVYDNSVWTKVYFYSISAFIWLKNETYQMRNGKMLQQRVHLMETKPINLSLGISNYRILNSTVNHFGAN